MTSAARCPGGDRAGPGQGQPRARAWVRGAPTATTSWRPSTRRCRCTTRSPAVRGDDWQVVVAGDVRRPRPDRRRNLAVRARPPRWPTRSASTSRRRCASTRTSRSPAAWPAAPPTPRPPWSRATSSGASASTATSCRARRRARQRRAVRPARRHRHRHRAAASSSRRSLARGTYHWVFALSDSGLSTPQVYAECDRLRGGRARARAPGRRTTLMAALRVGRRRALGAALHNDLQPAALSLRPSCGDVLDAGVEYGALGGVVSGSGPTVAFLADDARGRARPRGVADGGRRVPRRAAARRARSTARASCPARPPGPDTLSGCRMANLVALERRRPSPTARARPRRGVARRPHGRPDRRRRAQRRRQDHAAAGAGRLRSRRTPAASPAPAGSTVGDARPGRRRCDPACDRARGGRRRPARARLGRRPAGPRRRSTACSAASERRVGGLDAVVGPLSGGERRRRRAGRAARRRPRPAAPRRADQPPRRRGRRLAGRPPRDAAPRPGDASSR